MRIHKQPLLLTRHEKVTSLLVILILVLLIGMTVISGCVRVSWMSSSLERIYVIGNGSIGVAWLPDDYYDEDPSRSSEWYCDYRSVSSWAIDWLPKSGEDVVWKYVSAPLWPFIILIAVPIALRTPRGICDVVWRGRITRGLCGYCGYDLTRNTSGICPECGKPSAGRE